MPSYKVTFYVKADSDAEAAEFAAKVLPEFTEITVDPVDPYTTWGAVK